MCNLYDLGRSRRVGLDEWESAIARVISESEEALSRRHSEKEGPLPKRFGIRKTDPGLVLTLEKGEPVSRVMRWGFHRPFNPAINNARSEKLDGVWAEPWKARHRCLIPMTAFYEWQGSAGAKQTFAIVPPEGNYLWAGGIWEQVETAPNELPYRYSMLTTAAAGPIAEIHDRMPVILSTDRFSEFLEGEDPRGLLGGSEVAVELFRCQNPLKNPDGHEGPVRETFLPGFD